MFQNFPYTDMHQLNLDWIIEKIVTLDSKFDEAISSKIKIADPLQWDITKQYEMLTMVQDDNTIYLSMQPVPEGIDLSNTDYWQMAFNMQDFYDMIDDLRSDLNDELQSVEDDLNDKIDTLDENTVKTNNAKYLLFCGDSYSTQNDGLLFTTFVEKCGIPASHCHNVAVSGASFAQSANTYLNQIAGYTGDKTEITDILIAGGINDAALVYDVATYPDTTALLTAIADFMTYVKNNYPNATVSIAYIGGCMTSSDYYVSAHPAKSQEIAQWAYTVVAQNNGYRVLPTYNVIHSDTYYYGSDGLHPSQTGDLEIGSAIAKAFNNEYVAVYRPTYAESFNFSHNISRSGALSYKKATVNDMTTIDFDTFYFFLHQNDVISNNYVEFMDLNTTRFRIKEKYCISCTVLINNFTDTPNYHPIPATLKFENGKVSIQVQEVSNGSFKTFTAASNSASVTIPGFTLLLKTADIN